MIWMLGGNGSTQPIDPYGFWVRKMCMCMVSQMNQALFSTNKAPFTTLLLTLQAATEKNEAAKKINEAINASMFQEENNDLVDIPEDESKRPTKTHYEFLKSRQGYQARSQAIIAYQAHTAPVQFNKNRNRACM